MIQQVGNSFLPFQPLEVSWFLYPCCLMTNNFTKGSDNNYNICLSCPLVHRLTRPQPRYSPNPTWRTVRVSLGLAVHGWDVQVRTECNWQKIPWTSSECKTIRRRYEFLLMNLQISTQVNICSQSVAHLTLPREYKGAWRGNPSGKWGQSPQSNDNTKVEIYLCNVW